MKPGFHSRRGGALALIAFTVFAGTAAAQSFPQTVTTRNFFKVGNDSLTFHRPVLVKPYPNEDSAFIVLQQNGGIVTARWNGTAWRKTDSASVTVFCGASGSDEQGLLGFAFHPNYAQNRKYYTYYVEATGSGCFSNNFPRFNMVAERTAGSSGRPATDDPQRTILRLRDPYDNHNGGTIGFDKDGYLVVGIGDGGTTQGDPQNRAQNLDSLHGKFLRLDVDSDAFPDDTTRNYAIPATNPFAVSGGRPEIWAYGARNPFKWSFHPVTGEIWLGDVGQWDWEEVTRVPKGANLGWRIREGNACFNPSSGCTSEGLLPPALTLARAAATCIVGGAFFVGPASAFNGAYIFGDHGTNRVWAARVQNDSLVDLTELGTVNKVVSFDRDRAGRILATTMSSSSNITNNSGRVLVLESPDMVVGPVSVKTKTRESLKPISLRTVLADPARYELTRLDGTKGTVDALSRGMYLVREKGAADPARVMTVINP